jgi:RNA polymerase sigma-70 factor (ECF subfamily)
MTEVPDFADLLSRIRAGDEQAARDFVGAYEPYIRRVVRFRMADARLNRAVDSVDICQSVLASFFLRAAAGQYDLDDPRQLLALLASMARNKLAHQVRKENAQRRDARRNVGLDDAPLPATAPTPSRVAAGKELLESLRRHLTDEERRVADLRGQGLGWPEIAAQLGGTPDGRRMLLTRALDRVSRELGLEDAAPPD